MNVRENLKRGGLLNGVLRTRVFFVSIFIFCALLTCTGESPTVIIPPAQGSVAGVDTGILNPMIQRVYPGKLQSLDVPLPSEDGVSPTEPGIVVVFSQAMANTADAMGNSIALVDASYPLQNIPVLLKPAASSNYFAVVPDYPPSTGILKGSLKSNTTYLLRIYKTAAADTADKKTLVFSNLVEPPASTVSPADPLYVEYMFKTGDDSVASASPSIAYTLPSNGSSAVNKDAPGGNDVSLGPYIEIGFHNTSIPMIDPSTVNDKSVTLYNDTDGAAVNANSIQCVYTDTDFKKFRFYTTALLSVKHYTLTIGSTSFPITDFAGNKVPSSVIGFTTQ